MFFPFNPQTCSSAEYNPPAFAVIKFWKTALEISSVLSFWCNSYTYLYGYSEAMSSQTFEPVKRGVRASTEQSVNRRRNIDLENKYDALSKWSNCCCFEKRESYHNWRSMELMNLSRSSFNWTWVSDDSDPRCGLPLCSGQLVKVEYCP